MSTFPRDFECPMIQLLMLTQDEALHGQENVTKGGYTSNTIVPYLDTLKTDNRKQWQKI